MSNIGANELVFNNDKNGGIYSGGFSVNSIMMKGGFSPIMTLNDETTQKGGVNNVSDIFNDLVVPNWAISYPTMHGGNHSEYHKNNKDDDSDDDIIEDDIHDKLLALVKQHETTIKKKKFTKKNINPKNSKNDKNDKSSKNNKISKGGTKKNK